MDLRDKYRALLMTYSQQEEPLPSGYIVNDFICKINYRIYWIGATDYRTGNVGASSGNYIYYIKIPKGATQLLIKTNSAQQFIRSSACLGYSNIAEPTKYNNCNQDSYYQKTEALIELNTDYQYIGITIGIAPDNYYAKLMTYEFI